MQTNTANQSQLAFHTGSLDSKTELVLYLLRGNWYQQI